MPYGVHVLYIPGPISVQLSKRLYGPCDAYTCIHTIVFVDYSITNLDNERYEAKHNYLHRRRKLFSTGGAPSSGNKHEAGNFRLNIGYLPFVPCEC